MSINNIDKWTTLYFQIFLAPITEKLFCTTFKGFLNRWRRTEHKLRSGLFCRFKNEPFKFKSESLLTFHVANTSSTFVQLVTTISEQLFGAITLSNFCLSWICYINVSYMFLHPNFWHFLPNNNFSFKVLLLANKIWYKYINYNKLFGVML